MRRTISKQTDGLFNVGMGMSHIAGQKLPILRFRSIAVRISAFQQLSDHGMQFVERCPFTAGNVVNLTDCRRIAAAAGQQIRLDHIIDEAKIAAGCSVAVDERLFPTDHTIKPLWNDCRISAVRILASPEHIEIPQADTGKIIKSAKDACIQFIQIFCDCVG